MLKTVEEINTWINRKTKLSQMQRVSKKVWKDIPEDTGVQVFFFDDGDDDWEAYFKGIRGCFMDFENFDAEIVSEPVKEVNKIFI